MKFCDTPTGYNGAVLPGLEQIVDFLGTILTMVPLILITEGMEVAIILRWLVNFFFNSEISAVSLRTYQKLKHSGQKIGYRKKKCITRVTTYFREEILSNFKP